MFEVSDSDEEEKVPAMRAAQKLSFDGPGLDLDPVKRPSTSNVATTFFQ